MTNNKTSTLLALMKLKKYLKFLASLKLAVIVIVLMTVLIAWGTLIEAKYQDAEAAKRQVYQSWYMYLVFGVFALNLTAVMVDRWPWQRKHVSFVLAHIGIIILLLGSLVTFQWGIDGTLRIPIEEKAKYVFIPDTHMTVWSSFDGDSFTKVFEVDVDFYKKPPTAVNPLVITTDKGNMEVREWKPYSLVSRSVKRSEFDQAGGAIQFTIKNPMVNVTEWLLQNRPGVRVTHDFGPARIHFGPDQGPSLPPKNELNIELTPLKEGQLLSEAQFKYSLYHLSSGEIKKGTIKVGESFSTNWMGLEFKILQFLSKAEESQSFQFVEKKSDITSGAVKIHFQDKDHWLSQNDILKLFTDSSVYYVTYSQKRIDLGFDIYLKEFRMDRYPGTQRAATYQSLVTTPEGQDVWISMNEPLKYRGFTFYQASFQQAADGTPTATILSVNYDPGRYIKHLGSLILSLGVIVLFYDRRRLSKSQLAPRDETKV